MTRVVVAVLMGGASPEHDISLETGRNVAAALDRSRYDVRPVVIGRDGMWTLAESSTPVELGAAAEFLKDETDVVFIAMHGPYGEDGRVQGFLDMLGVPYTGSGVRASSVAMDKALCKDVVARHGVTVPRHVVVSDQSWQTGRDGVLDEVERDIGYPCVVKPVGQGSSVGMGIPQDERALAELMPQALDEGPNAMVEQYIAGTEITGSVFGTPEIGSVRAFPVTEIVPVAGDYFDFESKYTEGGAQEIVPARIRPELAERARQISVTVHTVLGCQGMSRSDMIVSGDDIFFIEVNTIPGMTDLSLYPQAAAADGIEFGELVGMLVEDARAVHRLRAERMKGLRSRG